MLNCRKKVRELPAKDLFEEINKLLKKYGLEDQPNAESLTIRFQNIDCPPDKRPYCVIKPDGSIRCSCRKK